MDIFKVCVSPRRCGRGRLPVGATHRPTEGPGRVTGLRNKTHQNPCSTGEYPKVCNAPLGHLTRRRVPRAIAYHMIHTFRQTDCWRY
jgi:hypothetical protein